MENLFKDKASAIRSRHVDDHYYKTGYDNGLFYFYSRSRYGNEYCCLGTDGSAYVFNTETGGFDKTNITPELEMDLISAIGSSIDPNGSIISRQSQMEMGAALEHAVKTGAEIKSAIDGVYNSVNGMHSNTNASLHNICSQINYLSSQIQSMTINSAPSAPAINTDSIIKAINRHIDDRYNNTIAKINDVSDDVNTVMIGTKNILQNTDKLLKSGGGNGEYDEVITLEADGTPANFNVATNMLIIKGVQYSYKPDKGMYSNGSKDYKPVYKGGKLDSFEEW